MHMSQDDRSLLARTSATGKRYCGYVNMRTNPFALYHSFIRRTIRRLKPPWLRLAAAIVTVAVLAFGRTSEAKSELLFVASTSGCTQAETRQVVDSFIGSFNRGDVFALDQLLGDSVQYQVGPPHGRVSTGKQTRNDVIGYLSDRHKANEQLRLESFQFRGQSAGSSGFEFEVTRDSTDGLSAAAYGGKGSVECRTSQHALVLWVMDREPFIRARLPLYVGLAVLSLTAILVGAVVAFRARTRRRVRVSTSSSPRR